MTSPYLTRPLRTLAQAMKDTGRCANTPEPKSRPGQTRTRTKSPSRPPSGNSDRETQSAS